MQSLDLDVLLMKDDVTYPMYRRKYTVAQRIFRIIYTYLPPLVRVQTCRNIITFNQQKLHLFILQQAITAFVIREGSLYIPLNHYVALAENSFHKLSLQPITTGMLYSNKHERTFASNLNNKRHTMLNKMVVICQRKDGHFHGDYVRCTPNKQKYGLYDSA